MYWPFLTIDLLNQWFSTFNSWRPSKQNKIDIGDTLLNTFGVPGEVFASQKWFVTHLLRNFVLIYHLIQMIAFFLLEGLRMKFPY